MLCRSSLTLKHYFSSRLLCTLGCQSCQLRAWRGGHRRKCEDLRHRYDIMDESLRAIDSIDEEGRYFYTEYGLIPNIVQSLYSDSVFHLKLGHPSMVHFYENLKRVVRKEWWLFDEADTADEYMRKEKADDDSYVLHLSVLLCYDYVSYENENDVSVKDAFPEMTSLLNELAERFGSGAVMPAERYVAFFSPKQLPTFARDRKKYRSQMKAEAKIYLRKECHK